MDDLTPIRQQALEAEACLLRYAAERDPNALRVLYAARHWSCPEMEHNAAELIVYLERAGDDASFAAFSLEHRPSYVELLAQFRPKIDFRIVMARQAMVEAEDLLRRSADYIAKQALEDPAGRLGDLISRLESLRDDIPKEQQDHEPPAMSMRSAERIAKRPAVMSTGLPRLDSWLGGGLRYTEHTAIAGPSGRGKSCLALTFAVNLARAGKRVLYVSGEMSEEVFTQRLLAHVTEDKHAGDDFVCKAMDGAWTGSPALDGLRVSIRLDLSTVSQVVAAMHEAKSEGDPFDLVIVDYLALFTRTDAKQSQHDALGDACRRLTFAAKRFECHMVSVYQLNRSSESRSKSQADDSEERLMVPITMRELKGSSEIENIVENIIGLDSNDKLFMEDPRTKQAERVPYVQALLNVCKARSGPGTPWKDLDNTTFRLGHGTFRVTQAPDYSPEYLT